MDDNLNGNKNNSINNNNNNDSGNNDNDDDNNNSNNNYNCNSIDINDYDSDDISTLMLIDNKLKMFISQRSNIAQITKFLTALPYLYLYLHLI